MFSDVFQGVLELRQVDGFEAIPVGDVVVFVNGNVLVAFVEVVFVKNESPGEDVAEDTGEGSFA